MLSVLETLKKFLSYPIKYLPAFRKKFWTLYYDFIAQTIHHDDFVYINFGYADLNGKANPIDVVAPDLSRHFSDQLYQRVAGAVDLRDREILEIGCGRGGGSAYLMRQMKPKTLMAVDISGRAIKRCRRTFPIEGLSFKQADAESLPFRDNCFDAVISVEASHLFTSRARFFAEVKRLLRPQGYFLFADILNPLLDKLDAGQLQRLLNQSGLMMVEVEDISPNVIQARELLSDSFSYRSCITRWTGSSEKRGKFLSSFFCLKGTPGFERLKTGKMQYWRWVMQRP